MVINSGCEKSPIDVILPIYNAFDYVKKCLATILTHTDLKSNRLILINDKSSDERVLPFLQSFVEAHPSLNIVLIDNEENQGFVKTVNIGMSYSNRDVVLLNSDTEVTHNWLVKLNACAYAKPCVATVTPLSNNATIASVPCFCEENWLPDGYSLDEYAACVEACSMHCYPELPTAHGFCMYICREALDKVGLFDADTFGKGYGEENDFSYRCLQHGYRHLLCDDTYIYHKGTQSFSKEKKELLEGNLSLLQMRYPSCFENTCAVVFTNPYEAIQQNVRYGVEVEKRKNILFFIHDFQLERKGNIGGTSLHIHDMIRDLKSIFNIHVCYYVPRKDNYQISSFFTSGVETSYVGGPYTHYTQSLFYHDRFRADLCDAVSALKIDLIHIHHAKNFYLDIFQIAGEKGIPLVYTFHDFYSICPAIQMFRKDGSFCDAKDLLLCSACMEHLPVDSRKSAFLWRREMHRNLQQVNKLVAPSVSVRDRVRQIFPDLEIEVIEHGYDVPTDECMASDADSKIFRVAFLGGISDIKGLHFLKYFIKESLDSNVEIHLFGLTSEKAYNRSRKNYFYHGEYLREDLPHLLKEHHIDLVCLLSLCPETFSNTLSECLVSLIPVITLDLGATAERVRKINAGWVLPCGSKPVDIWHKVLSISKFVDNEYAEKKQAVKTYLKQMPSIAVMDEAYADLYDQLIATVHRNDVMEEEYIHCKMNFFNRNSTPVLQRKDALRAKGKYAAMKRMIKGNESIHKVYKEIIRYCKLEDSVGFRGTIWKKFLMYRILGFYWWARLKK